MMKNMKIGKKLLLAFMVIIIGLAAVGVYGVFSINSITDADQALYHNNLLGISGIADITETFFTLRTNVLKTAYENFTAQGADSLEKTLNDTKAELNSQFETYAKTIIDQEDRNNIDNLKKALDVYEENILKVISVLKSGDPAGLKDQMAAAASSSTAVADLLNKMQDYNNNQGEATMTANRNLGSRSNILMTAVAAAAAAVAILFAVTVTRGITRPVNKLVGAAKKIAAGDTDIDLKINTRDEVGMLAGAFDEMVASIRKLIADANMLSEAAVAGEFDIRADAEKHQGDYRKIVEGVNATLDTVVEKVFWYEGLLDSIPFPISVTDMDMNWTFVNKPVEQMLKIKRRDVLGKQCSNWNAGICNTENCGIARLRNGQLQTQFEQMNMNFQVDSTYIYNTKGEKVGHIELVQDVTAKARSTEYSANEVAKLAHNLKQLKEGDLKLQFNVGEGDQYTVQDRENFEEINRNFKEAVDAISGYIDEMAYVLGSFAERDLTQEITREYRGDFVTLKESINHITNAMNELLLDISLAADQVAAGSGQVSQGNQAISQGATQQASSIEELTASLNLVAEQTHENAENSKKSNEMAMGARMAAVEGNDQMKNMLKSMEKINESSENISRIIKVIDDIAFQTNILALNAAVEAARAGVHGKGFAVVAEEVRNLAARSANAARETTELIEESIRTVGEGARIAQSTAGALEKIVDSVNNTVKLGEGIAAASAEQAAGISEINQGVEQMSQVVQMNSATAQEGAAASEELSGQAELLKEKIGSFQLRKGNIAGYQDRNSYETVIHDKVLSIHNDKY